MGSCNTRILVVGSDILKNSRAGFVVRRDNRALTYMRAN